jgi:AraC family transcriptional regulator of adaptative response / DNA-3-methyladenine glycosylase II
VQSIGCTPKQVVDTRRVGFARKLLLETHLPITEIAFSAGFNSIRQFNAVFKSRFFMSPRRMRRQHLDSNSPKDEIELQLSFRPPLEWDNVLQYIRSHLVTGVETVEGDAYVRLFRIGAHDGVLKVRRGRKPNEVSLTVQSTNHQHLYQVVRRVRDMLDLDSDPQVIGDHLQKNPIMRKLVRRGSALRVVRGWDPFERIICVILGQLVSTERAQHLVEELVRAYGEQVAIPISGRPGYLFPKAEVLAKSDLAAVSTTGARKAAIREVSRLAVSGEIDFSGPPDFSKLRQRLLAIKGIGLWTVEYSLLRAFGDPDAFPAGDLILQRVLQAMPDLDIESLRPWRSYAALYLWREYAGVFSNKLTSKERKHGKKIN